MEGRGRRGPRSAALRSRLLSDLDVVRRTLFSCWSMIFSENRSPLFGIMLRRSALVLPTQYNACGPGAAPLCCLLLAHDLFRKPVPTPHQVRGRLFRDHALADTRHPFMMVG